MQPTSSGPADELGPDEKGCTWCERGSGMILIAGAAGLLYIGIDLLTGGWLSRLMVGGVTRAAEAIDPGEEVTTAEPGSDSEPTASP
jgi:hypothetical protein